MLTLIKELCALSGCSGNEGEVRRFIESKLSKSCKCAVDPLGNLIVTHSGTPPHKKLALFAHMDEVGLMITHITNEGLLKFTPIGIDPQVLFGRRIKIGAAGVLGAVGAKVWHHLESAERDGELKSENLFLDIGALNKAEAEAVVSVGDMGVFADEFTALKDDFICSKALDDRVGCAILLELLNSDFPFEFTGVFSCGEEHSLFGAQSAAFTVAPEIAVILETTTAGDRDSALADKVVCSLGKGPVVSFADRGTLYDRELFALAFKLAKAKGIPLQTKEGVFGGNEARAVSVSGKGVRVLALSIPCRYLHSASSVAKLSDIHHARAFAPTLLLELAAL